MAKRSPANDYMSDVHSMDYSVLDFGKGPVSKTSLHLVDLDVHVHGLKEIEGGSLPVAIILLAHGWQNSAKVMDPLAAGIIHEVKRHATAQASGKQQRKDVLVVTLDQRNHGERERVKMDPPFDTNPARLAHMAMTVTGGKQDHQLVMDFLPGYLFPKGERQVVEFLSAGVSMGGHVTWRLLREDPRIKIGVPMISIPSEALGGLLTARVRKLAAQGIQTHYPASVAAYFESRPPADAYAGKKVLAIYGKEDRMLPPRFGQEAFDLIASRAVQPGDVVQFIQDNKGHVVSREMVGRAAEWFWRWSLSV